jgi:hypothetical protein
MWFKTWRHVSPIKNHVLKITCRNSLSHMQCNVAYLQNSLSVLQQLIGDMSKLHVSTSTNPPTSPSPPQHQVTLTSIPYQPPHTRNLDHSRPPPIHHPHHDPPRREDDWCQHHNSSNWQQPRTELSKFDGSNLLDWLEDCEYYFRLAHI